MIATNTRPLPRSVVEIEARGRGEQEHLRRHRGKSVLDAFHGGVGRFWPLDSPRGGICVKFRYLAERGSVFLFRRSVGQELHINVSRKAQLQVRHDIEQREQREQRDREQSDGAFKESLWPR